MILLTGKKNKEKTEKLSVNFMDVLLDSNIIIYASYPSNKFLLDFIQEHSVFVSAISYVEVLGFHLLKEKEKQYLETFFQNTEIVPLNFSILKEAVKLKQSKKMSLGDALVAATAIERKLTLVTHNTKDFSWIKIFSVLDPFK